MFAHICVDLTYLLETGDSQGLKGVDMSIKSTPFFMPHRDSPFSEHR